jgi:hypothetical protein
MALRPLDPAIVNAYQAPKFNMPDPLQDVAALEQIKSGRVNRQIHEQQLAQLQQDRLALDEMQKRIEAAGGPSNLKSAFTEMINSKLPKYAEIGYAGLQKIKEQEDFQSLINPKAPEAPPGPAVSTAPVPGQAISMMPVNAPRNALATPQTDNANQLAAITAPQAQPSLPTNMLASDLDQLDRQIQAAYGQGTPRALAYAKALEARRDELNKNIVVSPGSIVFQGGKEVYRAPEKSAEQPTLVKEFLFARSPEGGNFKGTIQDFRLAMAAAGRTPAQPLAPMPTLDKTTGQVVYATREQVLQNPGRFVPTSEKPEQVKSGELRDEFNALTKDFRAVQDAHTKITTTSPTGAGDMSLLYNYVKLLDPTSVVRENEFAAAAASGSFGERVQTAVNKVMTGQRLDANLRKDFINEASNLYKAQKAGADRIKDQYTNMAKRAKLNPEDVIVDYAAPAAPVAAGTSSNIPQAAIDFLKQGRGTREQFDAQFGLGSAKKVLGN